MINMVIVSAAALAFVGLLLTALYAGIETGVYTLNRVRLAVRVSAGDRRAQCLHDELRRPNRLLSTLMIGANLGTYLGSLGIAAILDALHCSAALAIAIDAAVLTPLVFILAETLPKDLFRTHTDRWSYRWASFLRLSRLLFTWTGLVPLVQGVGQLAVKALGGDIDSAATARQRMSQLIKEGVRAGVLSEMQTTLIDRVLAMRSRTVGSEMVPWKYVVALSAHDERAAHLSILQKANFTRMPVIDRPQHVVGMISALDVMIEPDKPLASLMKPALTLPPHTPVREALQTLRTQRTAMAIVVGPDGQQALGVVTIKDLVEPLIGDLAAW